MRQFFFLVLLALFGLLSLYRPVYELGEFYHSTLDFENVSWIGAQNNSNTITNEKAHSGTHSSKLDAANKYGYIFQVNGAYLPSKFVLTVNVKAYVLTEQDLKGLYLVCSCQKPGQQSSFWAAEQVFHISNSWNSVETTFNIGRELAPEDEISVYFWNREGMETVYVDDLEVSYY